MWARIRKFAIPAVLLVCSIVLLNMYFSYRVRNSEIRTPPQSYLDVIQGKLTDVAKRQSELDEAAAKPPTVIAADIKEPPVVKDQPNPPQGDLPKLTPDADKDPEMSPDDWLKSIDCKNERNEQREEEWLTNYGKENEQSEKVKEMFRHAWFSYKKYAWGKNELAPRTKKGTTGVFPPNMGLTIVDSLDTLYIMGLYDEVEDGMKWVENSLLKRFASTPSMVSTFEFNIRFVGGFLSMYALTNECRYLKLAKHCADLVAQSFSTKGFPPQHISLQLLKSIDRFNDEQVVLAEIGTIHLEFVYLSHILKDDRYKKLVETMRTHLQNAAVEGLYGNRVYAYDAEGKLFGNDYKHLTVNVGGQGDSFYEYLMKSYIQSNKKDERAKTMYFNSIQALENHGLLKKTSSGLTYFATMEEGRPIDKSEHLTCFIGGTVALSAQFSENPGATLKLAEDLTSTCHESYAGTASGLGPDSFTFSGGKLSAMSPVYILRPEVVESYYMLYKKTDSIKYREWAQDMVNALEKYCRMDAGYAGLADVRLLSGAKTNDNQQQSFFLAETLKYLYLIFKDQDIFPLDKWVYNTEAHPLPVLT